MPSSRCSPRRLKRAVSTDTGECCALAEMLRVKARLLQAAGWAEAEEIETILIGGLEIARAQQALCWELRASCDLARLWQGQGRGREALKLLESIYEQFTEGFDMRDLRDAKALLENLRRSVGRRQSEWAGKRGTPNKKTALRNAALAAAAANPEILPL